MTVATFCIGAAMIFALVVGLRGGGDGARTLEGWSVGSRNFGSVLVFLLMAGELYTTFTFLGASGYAYGYGSASYYILCYQPMAFLLAYWLAPAIWRYARAQGLVSQASFFARKYDSKALGVLVACIGVVALVPYLVLQLKGLSIIVTTASYGAISPALGAWIGAIVMALYVVVSGMHGPASLALVKDVVILVVVVFLGLYLPARLAGGIGPMFAAIDHAHRGFLAFPAHGKSLVWFESTVAMAACGLYMWPHTFGAIYTARDEISLRRNATVAPIYALLALFALFVGFAALLRIPGLADKDIDLALFKVALLELPPIMIGVIGAVGVLTALVPGSMMLMSASTTLARDIYPLMWPTAGSEDVARAAKMLVPVIAAVALYFALTGNDTIVSLLLMGIALVAQLFPSLIASLDQRRILTADGAIAGICVGVLVVIATSVGKSEITQLTPHVLGSLTDLNVGIIALGLNVFVAVGISLVTRVRILRR